MKFYFLLLLILKKFVKKDLAHKNILGSIHLVYWSQISIFSTGTTKEVINKILVITTFIQKRVFVFSYVSHFGCAIKEVYDCAHVVHL